MTGEQVAWPLALVALLLFTSYLAAVETVVGRINLVRALRLDDEDRAGSSPLLWLAEHRVTVLNVLLVATVTARVALAAGAAVLGWRWAGWVGAAAIAAVVVVLSLVLGEVVPRTVALRHLEPAGLALAGSARLLVQVASPVARLVVGIGRVLVPRRHEVSGPYASDEELRGLDVEEGEQDEQIEPEERAMIRSIFELADTRVREIMTPRPDMVMVPADLGLAAVVDVVVDRGYSRLPVHAPADPDTVVGVVYAKDLLGRVAGADGAAGWDDLVRSPTYVPETKRGDELLRELQASAVHLAVVVDEYGAVVGLVTIEDILEEIVGEIVDEHDHEEPLVDVLADGALRVDARLGVDDLNELLDAALPEEGWDTVGGLVLGTLGRVPRPRETVEIDGYVITVESVQGRRVGKVVVRSALAGDGPGPDGADGA